MNLKETLGRKRPPESDDVNITPVMNIFLILVPFLLLTAVFVRISILEFSLPGTGDASTTAQRQQQMPVVTIVGITQDGFEVRVQGKPFPLIGKKDSEFDFDLLVNRLREVKARYQQTEDIILAPNSDVRYDTIIRVMDRCRENGFPKISIST